MSTATARVPPVEDWAPVQILTGFYVYALFTADHGDEPAYIGRSANVLGRIGGHLGNPSRGPHIARVTVLPCSSRDEMNDIEQRLIAQFCPPWNMASLPPDVLAQRIQARETERVAVGEPQADQYEPSVPRAAYTIPEVADSLGLSKRTVYRLTANGDLPSGLLGGRRVVLADEFDKFLQQQKAAS